MMTFRKINYNEKGTATKKDKIVFCLLLFAFYVLLGPLQSYGNQYFLRSIL
jgi:hypothetical protein